MLINYKDRLKKKVHQNYYDLQYVLYLNQLGNDQIYHYLKQEQQQKKAQNNQKQQQIHSQVILPSTTTTTTCSHQH